MAEKSGIAWTDATFNCWWGDTKVSEGCAHCYAEREAKRYGHDCFGDDKPRRLFGEAHWKEPYKWAKKAQTEGRKWRVFCASMADVFEDRPELTAERAKLWKVIEATESDLNWLLLTKRPDNIARMMPADLSARCWMLTTVESQRHVGRLDYLMDVPAAVHGVSCEPLLGPVIFNTSDLEWLDWIIAGGESGPLFRPTEREWVVSLRDQAASFGVPFFFKQWSGLRPEHLPPLDGVVHDALPSRP